MYYTYEELKDLATRPDATTEDRLRLFNWFEENDMREWNGYCFPLEDGLSIYPVYEYGDDDEAILVDAEIKR